MYIQDRVDRWKKEYAPVDFQYTNFDGGVTRGCHFVFDNYTVSIQWGAGNYCGNYDSHDFKSTPNKTFDAEIAVIDHKTDGFYPLDEDGDDVRGYVEFEDIQQILKAAKNETLPTSDKESEEMR